MKAAIGHLAGDADAGVDANVDGCNGGCRGDGDGQLPRLRSNAAEAIAGASSPHAHPHAQAVERPSAPPAPADLLEDALQAERDGLRALFPLPAPRLASTRGQPGRARNAAVALAVLAVAAAGVVALDPAWRTERHATAIGEQRTVALADGSRLTLDTATDVRVRWHLRSRQVDLLQGRARFDVAPSALRPLQVTAGSVQVRVVGTVFDVQRGTGAQAAHAQAVPARSPVRVAVLQGRVEVRDTASGAQAAWVLGPGQRLLAGVAVPGAVEPFDASRPDHPAVGWAQGRLVFDRMPLREALAEVQRYRSAPIRLHGDERLARQAVSGVFDAMRTDQLLDLLPSALGVRVQRHPDGSVDVSR